MTAARWNLPDSAFFSPGGDWTARPELALCLLALGPPIWFLAVGPSIESLLVALSRDVTPARLRLLAAPDAEAIVMDNRDVV